MSHRLGNYLFGKNGKGKMNASKFEHLVDQLRVDILKEEFEYYNCQQIQPTEEKTKVCFL